MEQAAAAHLAPGVNTPYTKPLLAIGDLRERLAAKGDISKEEKFKLRKQIKTIAASGKALLKDPAFLAEEKFRAAFKAGMDDLAKSTDFAPVEAILLISLSLGLGTMVGWKRIVITIGEKIGKSHLTYAQGAAAELVAAGTIGMSSGLGLPVSTTHVLSSGIAGSMVGMGGLKNLQRKTVTTIALAWVLTLPVTMIGGGLFYFLFHLLLSGIK
jgi:PiT family inorganic phosphate transporter